MSTKSPKLFIEINNFETIFVVLENIENDDIKVLYKDKIINEGISNNKIFDFDLIVNNFKKNIYLIEQKLNFTFKEAVIMIDNFECSIIALSGYKRLNGSQLVKENITYILNSLKNKIGEIEKNKTVLHIFNSKFFLDQKEIKNLPIGLFGNFYAHELSFFLIDNNDLKNLKNIFKQCNLKVKKIISKNFIEGVNLINTNPNTDTFFKIEINYNNSQILYFENSSLKFIQNFNFGSNLIINDISKVLSLKDDEIKKILEKCNFEKQDLENEYLEKEFFLQKNFRKIKKKLLFEIANARIVEFSEIILFKNINLINFLKSKKTIFLKINDHLIMKCFRDNLKFNFSRKNNFNYNLIDEETFSNLFESAGNIVQYGWKKEAVPIVQEKKSIIARIFELFAN